MARRERHVPEEVRPHLAVGHLRDRPSADVLVEQDGIAPYYRAVVELTEQEKERVGTELTPGMQANAMIQTGQRTALSYLTKPLADFTAVSFKEE